MTTPPSIEFSRPLHVDDLAPGGTVFEVEANDAERDLLARRLDLVSLDGLAATVHVEAMDAEVRVTGTLRADVTQSCVVTLEPVATHIEAPVERLFSAGEDGVPDAGAEITLSLDAEEPPEPIVDGTIDLGEIVAEQLALEIDPFPRRPGASFADQSTPSAADGDAAREGGPFAILAEIKENPDSGS